MPWAIRCDRCDCFTGASNIAVLIGDHRQETTGFFLCGSCSSPAYIKKEYKLQRSEAENQQQVWKPYLRGALLPRSEEYGYWYQPFIFLVSYGPNDPVVSLWFCYYKDLRQEGGTLKMGHGPGGPPVLEVDDMGDLMDQIRHSVSKSQ